MKLFPIVILSLLLVSGTLGQAAKQSLSLLVVRHGPATQKEAGPDFPGPHEKYTFRVANNSKVAFYIRGSDLDGDFDPYGQLMTFDKGQGKWLYLLSPQSFQIPQRTWPSGPEFERKLNPKQSITFQVLMTPCERNKVVVYVRRKGQQLYQPLFSKGIRVKGCDIGRFINDQ